MSNGSIKEPSGFVVHRQLQKLESPYLQGFRHVSVRTRSNKSIQVVLQPVRRRYNHTPNYGHIELYPLNRV